MDRILVPGLPLRARVGVTEAERAHAQEIVIEVELGIDLAEAGTRDELALTVDYDLACATLATVVESRPFRLIEAVAEASAQALLRDFPLVAEVRVQVRKPSALEARGVAYAAVEVRRTRG